MLGNKTYSDPSIHYSQYKIIRGSIVHALLWNNTYRSLACIIDNGDHIGSHALDKGKTFADIGQFVLTVDKI